MPDIELAWDGANARGDWAFANGDLVTGNDLATSVLISLFTDRRASDDYTPPDGNLRGWWADTYEPAPLGSRLWQLERAVISGTQPILAAAKRCCEEALQWLLDEDVASDVSVRTQWLARGSLGIAVQITAPGDKAPQTYAWAWSPQAPVPVSPLPPAALLDSTFILDSSLMV